MSMDETLCEIPVVLSGCIDIESGIKQMYNYVLLTYRSDEDSIFIKEF